MARIVDWETFFASSAGRTVAAWERGAYARFVAAKRGDRALQIGFAADLDPLEKSPIAHRIALSEDVAAIARDDLRLQVLGVSWALPFENESCDIVALPHGFDLHPDKIDATLEEVYRVLAPNGLFVTTFFNSIFSSRNQRPMRAKTPGLDFFSDFLSFLALSALGAEDTLCSTFSFSAIFVTLLSFQPSQRNYFVSLWTVCFLQKGQYLLSSRRSGVFFLFFMVL